MVRKYCPGHVVYLGKLGFLLVFWWIGLTFAVLNLEFMANHKATKKDVRQANKRRDRNRYYGKTTRNAIRDLRAIKGGKEAGEQLPEVASMIDKLAKKGVIHKNKAANLKSKLARKVNALNIANSTPAK